MTPPCLSLCHTHGGFNCHWKINPFSGELNINLKPAHHKNSCKRKEPSQCWPSIYGIASFLWHSVFRGWVWGGSGMLGGSGSLPLAPVGKNLVIFGFYEAHVWWQSISITDVTYAIRVRSPWKQNMLPVRFPQIYKPWNYFHRCVLTMKAPKYKTKNDLFRWYTVGNCLFWQFQPIELPLINFI